MEIKTLAKPPIREAIFEVLLNYPPNVNIDFIEGFGKVLAEDFPLKQEIFQIQGAVAVPSNSQPAQSVQTSKFGYAYISSDSKTFIQIRLNGFSFVKANKSYTKWEDFYPQASEWFYKYAAYTGAVSASRISLRFINQIELPGTTSELKDYILTTPEIGDSIKLPMKNLFMRVELINDEYDAIGIIQEALDTFSIVPKDTYSLYFDLDVVKTAKPEQEIKIEENNFHNLFQQLREFKNKLFFESFTSKAEELFK